MDIPTQALQDLLVPDCDNLCIGCVWGRPQSDELFTCLLPKCTYRPDVSKEEGMRRRYIIYTDHITGRKKIVHFVPYPKKKKKKRRTKTKFRLY